MQPKERKRASSFSPLSHLYSFRRANHHIARQAIHTGRVCRRTCNVTLFMLTNKTVGEEAISRQMGERLRKSRISHSFQINSLHVPTIFPKEIRCALTYANTHRESKREPVLRLFCRALRHQACHINKD